MRGSILVSLFILSAALALHPRQAAAFSMFLRADVDGNGIHEITDAVLILGYLFLADPAELGCEDAADANDDGAIDISDPVSILLYLFQGPREIPAPFPDCGFDPTEDFFYCESAANCPHRTCGGILGLPCPEKSMCELPPGGCCCDFQGVCIEIPDGCPKIYDPVCGCDGKTYGNDCERQRAGMTKAHDGPCKE